MLPPLEGLLEGLMEGEREREGEEARLCCVREGI